MMESDSIFETTLIEDTAAIAEITNYINDSVPVITHNGNDVLLDFSTIYMTEAAGTTIKSYYVHSVSDSANVEFAVAAIFNSDSSRITGYMIAKTTHLSDSIKSIDYIDDENEIFCSIEIDLANETVDLKQLKPTGQNVMDCITDFYTRRGWLSVGLWVGTLLDPGIGVTVASACIVGQAVVR